MSRYVYKLHSFSRHCIDCIRWLKSSWGIILRTLFRRASNVWGGSVNFATYFPSYSIHFIHFFIGERSGDREGHWIRSKQEASKVIPGIWYGVLSSWKSRFAIIPKKETRCGCTTWWLERWTLMLPWVNIKHYLPPLALAPHSITPTVLLLTLAQPSYVTEQNLNSSTEFDSIFNSGFSLLQTNRCPHCPRVRCSKRRGRYENISKDLIRLETALFDITLQTIPLASSL